MIIIRRNDIQGKRAGAANDNCEQNSNKSCLNCTQSFVSQGPFHRLCDICRAEDRTMGEGFLIALPKRQKRHEEE